MSRSAALVCAEARAVEIREHAIELADRATHRLLQTVALIKAVRDVDSDELGIAVRDKPVQPDPFIGCLFE
jgi:hypothetical protein